MEIGRLAPATADTTLFTQFLEMSLA